MASTLATRLRNPDQGSRLVRPSDDVRRSALALLYERRSAIDNLIGALKRYRQEPSPLQSEASRP